MIDQVFILRIMIFLFYILGSLSFLAGSLLSLLLLFLGAK